MQGASAFERVREITGKVPRIHLRGGLKPSKVKGSWAILIRRFMCIGQFSFNDVVFSYSSRPDHVVFDGLNLSIEAGKVTEQLSSSLTSADSLLSWTLWFR